MEDAEEKMAALKRAYADILLNMAKESAARIVVSDRRALRYQQDLFRAKEEAVSTLLRVKGIMDSKINEAEQVSSSQVKRIRELELQLAEAEKTIKNLKVELKRANDELSDIKSNQMELLDKRSISDDRFTFSGCICLKASSQPTAKGQLSYENSSQAKPLEEFAKTNFENPVLGSIIMRSKESESYRNGCTQRIRAFEQSVLTRKIPDEKSAEEAQYSKCFNCNDKVNEELNVSKFPEADNVLTTTKKTNGCSDSDQHVGSGGRGQVLFQGFSLQRKRSRIKRLMSSVHAASNQVDGHHEPSAGLVHNNLIEKRTSECTASILETKGETPVEISSNLSPVFNGNSRDLSAGRDVNLSINENLPCVLKRQNSSHVETTMMGGDNFISDGHVCPHASSGLVNIEHETVAEASKPCSKPETATDVVSERDVRSSGNSMLVPEDDSRTNGRESGNLGSSPSEVEPDAVGHLKNPESVNGKGLESNGTILQNTTDKILKYTFSRKRKKGSSTTIDKNSLQVKDNIFCKTPEGKETVLEEPQLPTSLSGPSRDSRRIAQVARQLISLSEKRW